MPDLHLLSNSFSQRKPQGTNLTIPKFRSRRTCQTRKTSLRWAPYPSWIALSVFLSSFSSQDLSPWTPYFDITNQTWDLLTEAHQLVCFTFRHRGTLFQRWKPFWLQFVFSRRREFLQEKRNFIGTCHQWLHEKNNKKWEEEKNEWCGKMGRGEHLIWSWIEGEGEWIIENMSVVGN